MHNQPNTDLEQLLQDYATEPVPAHISVSGGKISEVNSALAFSLPGVMTGVMVVAEAGMATALWAFLLGGLALSLVGFATGIVGVRKRVSSYMLIRDSFGSRGANIVNLCIALSMFGWFGVNIVLFSSAMEYLLADISDITLPHWLAPVCGGALMTASAIFGFKSIQKLAAIIVPIQLLVLCVLLYKLVDQASLADILSASGTASMGLGEAVSAVVGSFIVSALVMPDLTRYGRSTKDAAIASFLPFLGSATLVYCISAAAAVWLSETDVLAMLQAAGLGILALVFVIFSSTITNAVNLYGCGLSIAAIVPHFKEWQIVIFSGIAGTAVAFAGISDHFIDFIFSLGIIFMPIGAIYTAHYILEVKSERLNKPKGPQDVSSTTFSWPAILAWLAGMGVAFLTSQKKVLLTQIPAFDALIASALAYVVLIKIDEVTKRRRRR
ncbi:purine-cytosine permease family protein [Microbulbifer agarilyticus]|uniref:purine-cytosine permease family protein n=1 Tax=Microbulbifer agarilyticus TaxID=260552 RepID=UPI001CD694CA|nr:cytosine permease [Microbulbifer agarilyticus]MCA0893066.1 cytosine permease [Microbulbifer agarilyticus]